MNLQQVDQAGLVVYTTKITLRSVFDFLFKLHMHALFPFYPACDYVAG